MPRKTIRIRFDSKAKVFPLIEDVLSDKPVMFSGKPSDLAAGSDVTVELEVGSVQGILPLHGKVLHVIDTAESKGFVFTPVQEMRPEVKLAIKSILNGEPGPWPPNPPPEVEQKIKSLKKLLGKIQTREVYSVLGIEPDATPDEIESAYMTKFIPKYHPDCFAGYDNEELKDIATTLFAKAKKIVERLKKEAERAATMVKDVKEEVKQAPPADPDKNGTTNPIQQIALGKKTKSTGNATHPPYSAGTERTSRPRLRDKAAKGTYDPTKSHAGKGDAIPLDRPGIPNKQSKSRPKSTKSVSGSTKHKSVVPTHPTSSSRPILAKRRRTAAGAALHGDPVQEALQGRSLLKKKQYAKAVEYFAKAAYLDQNSAEYKALLGWAKFNEDQVNSSEALSLMEKACKMDPDYDLPFYFLGLTYKTMKNYKKALDLMKKARQNNPHKPEYNTEIRHLERLLAQRKARGFHDEKNPLTPKGQKGGFFSKLFRKKKDD